MSNNLNHDEAIDALCGCAATVTTLSYQEAIEGYFALRGLPIPITPPEVGGELVERVTRKMYEDWPLKAVSPALASQAGVPLGSVISWERSIEIGADHSGLRRFARSAIATLSTPEVVDGNQVVRASAQEGTALSSQATEPQASPPCGLQSTDAGLIERVARAISRFTFATTNVSNTDCGEWEDMAESDREIYRDAARAALAEAKS